MRLSRFHLPALLVAAFLASRIPLLGGGYGSDDDAWRNALAALRMRETGTYVPSRVPGFPVFEGILVFLHPLGWTATNAAAALAQLGAALSVALTARRQGAPFPLGVGAAFLFLPGIWIETTQTMDYAFGLLFLAASYAVSAHSRWLAAGVLLGLATGCRITNATFLVPTLFLVWSSGDSRRLASMMRLLAGFLGTTALAFSALLFTPEAQGLLGHAGSHLGAHRAAFADVPVLARVVLVFLFGKAGLVAIGAGLLVSGAIALRGRAGRPATAGAKGAGGAAVRPDAGTHSQGTEGSRPASGMRWGGYDAVALLLVSVLYLAVPYTPAYMLPAAIPLLLLVGRNLRRGWWVIALAAFAVDAWVSPSLERRALDAGRLVAEVETRREQFREAAWLLAPSPHVRGVYVAGEAAVRRLVLLAPRDYERTDAAWTAFGPSGVALWTPGRDVGYAAALTAADRDSLAGRGYRILDLR